MTKHSNFVSSDLLRMLLVTLFGLSLAACGGGGSSGTDPLAECSGPVSNPGDLDVNGDNILDDDDDIDGDCVVDEFDQELFAANNPDPEPDPDPLSPYPGIDPIEEGNLDPQCDVKDCVSANNLWMDNSLISQNRSPKSSYAMGIQRIMFCLGVGTSAGSTFGAYSDGVYGPNSAMDVETYQNDKGLVSDGIVGEDTWDALQRDISFLIASGDGISNLYGVTSVRDGCEGLSQFVEAIAAPSGWQLVAVPGEGTYVPFSVNDSDRP